MKKYTIAITTFSKRYHFLEETLKKVREFDTKSDVIICINGEKDANFDQEYRKKVLNLCSLYDNIFPVFFPEIRGLSKMWNTCIIHSPTEDVLILNDDIRIHSEAIFNFTSSLINSKEYKGICKMKSTFSFFVVNKNLMNEVGYFDERLLGFGEEDGDITHRLLSMDIAIQDSWVDGLDNIVSDIRHDEIMHNQCKYSKFNPSFMFNQKYKKSEKGIKGMFSFPCEKVLEDQNPYPYESFFMENKKKILR
jgi:glycosyltransferase involved in cell wall biosynthesis